MVAMVLIVFTGSVGAAPVEAASTVEQEAYWQQVYSGQRILEIELRLTSQAWDAMQPTGGGRGDGTRFPYASGTLTIDGQKLDRVGMRFKGNSSYRFSERGLRRPFKIDTNRFTKGLKWFGKTKLNLSNSFKDSTYLREKLGYEIFHAAGLPTPGVGWAHVWLTIDGQRQREDLGLYVLVEQVDDDWVEHHYGADSANSLLMKPEGMFEWPYLGKDLKAYERYEIKEGETNTKLLQRFADFLQFSQESTPEVFNRRVGTFLDLDNWAQYFAANTLLVNIDSIVAMPHNYYLLVDQADGLIKILPWDLNECFGLFTVGASPEDLVRWDIRRPWLTQNRLLERLFEMPDFQRRYQEAIRKLLESAFGPAQISRRVAALQPSLEAILKGSGMNEQVRQMQLSIDGSESSGEGFRRGPIGLKYFVKERVASVERQLAGTENGVQLEQRRRRGGPPMGPPPGRGMIPGIAVIETLDVDRNGILTREEIEQAVVRLKKLDRNGDGKLSPAEYEMQRGPGGERPGFPRGPR
ncbi:MAG: CotH kinase family protein [Pirellulaceae bacterium]